MPYNEEYTNDLANHLKELLPSDDQDAWMLMHDMIFSNLEKIHLFGLKRLLKIVASITDYKRPNENGKIPKAIKKICGYGDYYWDSKNIDLRVYPNGIKGILSDEIQRREYEYYLKNGRDIKKI